MKSLISLGLTLLLSASAMAAAPAVPPAPAEAGTVRARLSALPDSVPFDNRKLSLYSMIPGRVIAGLRLVSGHFEGDVARFTVAFARPDWALTSTDPHVGIKELKADTEGEERKYFIQVALQSRRRTDFHLLAVSALGETEEEVFQLREPRPLAPVKIVPAFYHRARIIGLKGGAVFRFRPGFFNEALKQTGDFGEANAKIGGQGILNFELEVGFNQNWGLHVDYGQASTSFQDTSNEYLSGRDFSSSRFTISALWRNFEAGLDSRTTYHVLSQLDGVTVAPVDLRGLFVAARIAHQSKLIGEDPMLFTARLSAAFQPSCAGTAPLAVSSCRGIELGLKGLAEQAIAGGDDWVLRLGMAAELSYLNTRITGNFSGVPGTSANGGIGYGARITLGLVAK
ncbi:MAG: hypothetical protein EOP11_10045 [Proteobacteria bacterium]|nr:MAG: hypothetical protein EOP11_10045 [Pseudomonadota bacterium]